ncbi:MAG: glucosamine 6-phosphate synthetase [Brumimicrobium sp.]|nr:glucosamine 6-phosphate synthetase [Brumimicrobium sp.]
MKNGLLFAFGHTRLVTNGSQLSDENNQPVIKDGIVGVHNGIIVNDNEIWAKYPSLKRQYEIDTEVLISLLKYFLSTGMSLDNALLAVEKEIEGTISIALLFDDSSDFLVYSNYGSLYILTDYKSIFILASEKNILTKLIEKHSYLKNKEEFRIEQIRPLTGYLVNFNNHKITTFDLNSGKTIHLTKLNEKFSIHIENIHTKTEQIPAVVDSEEFRINPIYQNEREMLEFNLDRISNQRRCTKCILPDTFPFIEFDEKGVCNYCRNYKQKNQTKPISELFELVEPYRKKKGTPDVLIPFSGGRDSSFSLHIVKEMLNLNPIAYTYDWGMVTDLARRNIARLCGKLGVEHIIVSANIKWKRENIRKNILAWLRKPHLGMIPLFMAGDKYFYYYANKVKKQNDIQLTLYGMNNLENTDFKVGFAGIPPNFSKERIYSLKLFDQLRLFAFMGQQYLTNSRYLNQSLFDTIGSFIVRFFNPKEGYYHLFDYYAWNEKEIEDTIIKEYDWETSKDTKTTWRIGDGTASFYNYIYTTLTGFSENDTFRSNQIRENLISRDEALEFIYDENQPRYESLKWYLTILGLDFKEVIQKINSMPKHY